MHVVSISRYEQVHVVSTFIVGFRQGDKCEKSRATPSQPFSFDFCSMLNGGRKDPSQFYRELTRCLVSVCRGMIPKCVKKTNISVCKSRTKWPPAKYYSRTFFHLKPSVTG